MLVIFVIRPHWIHYWPIYAVQSRRLSALVDIYKCLFNQKRLGTPVIHYVSSIVVGSTNFSLSANYAHFTHFLMELF